MNSFSKLVLALNPTIADTYESRKIGRDSIKGVIVSTCWTQDQGYETAILDAERTHIVERYDSREDAVIGHQQWCVRAETIEQVIALGYDDIVSDKEVTIVRGYYEEPIGDEDELDCE